MRSLVVGTGFGCRIQVPALRGAGFEVAGLVGTDPDRTAERAAASDVPGSFTDLKEAIAATGAEVVAISTPPHTHAELSIAALESGCHVLCEKPFAANTAEAIAMRDAANRAGKVHMIGHEFRHEPARATVARAIADGMIGKPRFASLMLLLPQIPTSESEMPAWWFDPAEGGGWLGALGSHVIDQLRTWVGEFESVSASLSRVTTTRGPIDDSFSVRFRMTSGVEGVLQSSCGTWGPPLDITRIAGTEGTIRTEGGKVFFSGKGGEREVPIAPDLALPPPPPTSDDPRYQQDRWRNLVAVELAPYTVLCRSFKSAILDRQSAAPVANASFADGVACMQVMDAIRESAREDGSLVRVEHD